MKDKSFLLGIGSQRAGSTLLSQLLGKHPQVAMHPVKEIHYFDTLFDVRSEDLLKKFSGKRLSTTINKICSSTDYKFMTDRRRWQLKSDWELFSKKITDIDYSTLFVEPAQANYVKNCSFIGEITPEYMLLDGAQVATVKEVIGKDALIFLMCRNPLKRIVSSFRLIVHFNFPDKSQDELDLILINLIETRHPWFLRHMKYSHYSRAYEIYKAHFPNILPLCFDDIVQNPTHLLTQVSEFVGLDYETCVSPDFFKHKFNTLPIKYEPSLDVTSRLQKILSPLVEDLTSFVGRELIN